MFKSKLDEDLRADEIRQGEEDDLCYEIVKHEKEKLLTLEEARQLVEQNYLLNKEELNERIDDIYGTNKDPLLSQYINSNAGDADDLVMYNAGNQSDRDTEDDVPKYIGRGYGLLGAMIAVRDEDEDSLLDESDVITSTITLNQKAGDGPPIPMTNYGKGPPPSWSNVFADSSSNED